MRPEHGLKAPLFPDLPAYAGRRNKAATNRIGKWLRKLHGENGEVLFPKEDKSKSFYSLRHSVTTLLDEIKLPDDTKQVSADRVRYITGHAGKDDHSKLYFKHPVRSLTVVINQIPAPTL